MPEISPIQQRGTSPWDGIDLSTPIDPVAAGQTLGMLIQAMNRDVDELTGYQAPEEAMEETDQATSSDIPGVTSRPFEGDAPETGAFGEDRGGRAHAGIDFGVPMNTGILSLLPGTVITANTDAQGGGYGNFVLVAHGNGLTTRYAHLDSVRVTAGQTVSAGQLLGMSGTTGDSTGPHLHLETLLNGQPVDPHPYLAGGGTILGKVVEDPESPEAEPTVTPYTAEEMLQILTGEGERDITGLTGDSPTAKKAKKAAGAGSTGDFFGQVLAGIGAPDTPENRRALTAWARAEGMDAAHNNPFATTQGADGARVLNDHGVKAYADAGTGVMATIQTLTNGRYANIIAALRAGNDANAVASAIEASPWGTGGLVTKVLNG